MNKDFLGRVTALVLVILLSGGQLFLPRLPLLVAFLILMGGIKLGTNWRLSKRMFAPVALVLFILSLEVTRGSSDPLQVVIRAANFLCALLLLNIYAIRGVSLLQSDLLAVLRYLPHQTIATSILATVAPFLFFTIPGTVVKTFLFVLYHHTPDSGGHAIVRPDGFFWEPGIVQLYLCILLILSVHHSKPKTTILTIVVAIAATQSTTGLLNLCIILCSIFVTQFSGRGLKLLDPKVIGSLAIALVVIPISIGNIQEKVSGELKGSFYARSYDTLAGIEVATKYPWTGIGFTLETYLSESRRAVIDLDEYSSDVFSEREGNSNGIVTLLYTMGLPIGGLMIIGILRQRIIPKKYIAGPILIISLLSEPLTLFPFFLLLALSGIMRRPKHEQNLVESEKSMRNGKVDAASKIAAQSDLVT